MDFVPSTCFEQRWPVLEFHEVLLHLDIPLPSCHHHILRALGHRLRRTASRSLRCRSCLCALGSCGAQHLHWDPFFVSKNPAFCGKKHIQIVSFLVVVVVVVKIDVRLFDVDENCIFLSFFWDFCQGDAAWKFCLERTPFSSAGNFLWATYLLGKNGIRKLTIRKLKTSIKFTKLTAELFFWDIYTCLILKFISYYFLSWQIYRYVPPKSTWALASAAAWSNVACYHIKIIKRKYVKK